MNKNRTADGVSGRVPPGQYLVEKWPVLSYGPTPRFNPATWDFRLFGVVEQPVRLNYQQFRALPQTSLTTDFHCVTTWSRLNNQRYVLAASFRRRRVLRGSPGHALAGRRSPPRWSPGPGGRCHVGPAGDGGRAGGTPLHGRRLDDAAGCGAPGGLGGRLQGATRGRLDPIGAAFGPPSSIMVFPEAPAGWATAGVAASAAVPLTFTPSPVLSAERAAFISGRPDLGATTTTSRGLPRRRGPRRDEPGPPRPALGTARHVRRPPRSGRRRHQPQGRSHQRLARASPQGPHR